jgi:MFS family permease
MWLRHTSVNERRAMLAAYAGYGLDGFDFLIYTFVIPTLIALWGMDKAQAGYIASAALVTSAIGGWAAGILADRFGRVRVLQLTVVWFALFTFLSGFTHTFGELLVTRALQGFGFGGEWSVGSVLWRRPSKRAIAASRRRGAKQLVGGLGRGSAAFWPRAPCCRGHRLASAVLDRHSACLVDHLHPPQRARTGGVHGAASERRGRCAGARRRRCFLEDISAADGCIDTDADVSLATGMLGAYYAITTWLPTFLKTERHLSVTGTTGYLLMVIVGSLAGYLVSAWLADALGRRRSFMVFAGCAAVLILIYTHMPVSGGMLLIGFPLGFFVLGIFSGMGACFAELFPGEVRGSGQGFCYSTGRAIGAACPALIGAWSAHVSLGQSIGAMTTAAYALVVISAWALPETRGQVFVVDAAPVAGADPVNANAGA